MSLSKTLDRAREIAEMNTVEKQRDRTFQERLRRDYNRETITLYGDGVENTVPAIIETSKLNHKVDYKKIATEFNEDIQAGSLIYWIEDDSSWLIYNRRNTEDNHFYGEMEEAKYIVKWVNKHTGKVLSQLGVFKRGRASEIKNIAYVTTQNVQYLDGSATLMLPRNETSLQLLRYDRFRIHRTVWQVTGYDEETFDNIILFNLEEHEKNPDVDEDDLPNAHLTQNAKIVSSLDRKEKFLVGKPFKISISTLLNGKPFEDSYELLTEDDIEYDESNSTITIHDEGEVKFTINSKETSAFKDYTLDSNLELEESRYVIRGQNKIRATIFHEYYIETGKHSEAGQIVQAKEWYVKGDKEGKSDKLQIKETNKGIKFKSSFSGIATLVAIMEDGTELEKRIDIVSVL